MIQMVSLIRTVTLLDRKILVLTGSVQFLRYGEQDIQGAIIERLGDLLKNPWEVKRDPMPYVSLNSMGRRVDAI